MRKNKKQKEFLEIIQHNNLDKTLEIVNWSKDYLLNQLDNNPTFMRAYYKLEGLSDKQKEFLEVFPKTFFNITRTCKLILVGRKTFYRWKKESKVFRDELESVREGIYDDVESVLFHKIFVDRDTTSLIFFMKTKMKHRGYSEKLDIKVDLQASTKSDNDEIKSLSDEELNERIKLLNKRMI